MLHQNFDNRFAVVKKYQGYYLIVKTKIKRMQTLQRWKTRGEKDHLAFAPAETATWGFNFTFHITYLIFVKTFCKYCKTQNYCE